ncbi:MAG: adenine deaminase C-terminal domain-containing protein, partial [Pseudomonadota bacterium]
APGRRADMVITADLERLPIEMVIARGQVVAEDGVMTAPEPEFEYPEATRRTVQMRRRLRTVDFDIGAPMGTEKVRARVIGVVENQAPTKALMADLRVDDGIVQMDWNQDICQIALVERHRATGSLTHGFVSGFGYDVPCAMASTVAHDSHHMIVVGTSRSDMALAANRLAEVGGGICIFRNGQELALVRLPIAGLISERPAHHVAAEADKLMEAMRNCGCQLNNAYMQHSLLALVVIPELRISDKGLIDVRTFEKTGLFV